MRQYHFIVITLITVFICFFVLGCGIKEEIWGTKREVVSYGERILEIERSPEISINLDSGNIEIYSWRENSVKFEITERVRGMEEKEVIEKKLKNFSIFTENENNIILISIKYEGVINNPADIFTDLRVYIPQKIRLLDCKLDIGKIKIYDDLRCMLKLNVDTVNVNINRFEGILAFSARMGDLRVSGGKILKGSTINTGMGNILIKAEIESSGDYHFGTGVGNIELSLPEKSNFMLQCEGNLRKNEFLYNQKGALVMINNQMGEITVEKY